VGLLKNARLLRHYALRNDIRSFFASLRAIRRIARQSQALRWDFSNSPNVPIFSSFSQLLFVKVKNHQLKLVALKSEE